MESVTTRTLEIDGMRGEICVKNVTAALKGVHDVTTQSVKVGGATIKADQAGCKAACAAVDRAGYPASEAGCVDKSADAGADCGGGASKDANAKSDSRQGAQKAQGGYNAGNQPPSRDATGNPRNAEHASAGSQAKPAAKKN